MNFIQVFTKYAFYSIWMILATPAYAIDAVPGMAIAPPTDLNALRLTYSNVEKGSQYANGQPILNTQLNLQTLQLRYTRTFALNQQPAAFYLQTGQAELTPKGVLSTQADANGMTDTAAAFAYWLHADKAAGEYLGLASYLLLSTGQYDSNQLVNLGANRYSFAQQIAYQTRLTPQWDLMLTADVQLFGENEDFRLTHQSQKQAPLYSTQATLMYNLTAKSMLAASLYHHQGGETSLDGTAQNDRTRKTRYGLAYSQLTSVGKFFLQYGKDSQTENGMIENHQIHLRWLVAWQ